MQDSGPIIRPMRDHDWDAVERIYAQGIESGNATFETATPTKDAFFASRIPELLFVAEDADGAVGGWVAASPTSTRPVYRGVVEHSIYVDAGRGGSGVATGLVSELITRAQSLGYWTIQSGIFPENEASRALHLKLGFREVGRRERIGFMDSGPWAGTWRDTILYELRL